MRLLTLLLLAVPAVVVSQIEPGGVKTIKMPKPDPSAPSVVAPVPDKPSFGSISESKPSRGLDLPQPNSNFGKAPQKFDNPHAEVQQKLNKQSYAVYDVDVRRNQYLGEIKTKSKIGRIQYRDYDRIDGDVIRIYINGVVTQPQIILDEDFTGFDITFQQGINLIEFESLSEGFAPPNTAELVVLDENGQVLLQNGWAIANGFKASVTILRE